VTAAGSAELVVHAGGDDLLPIHETPRGASVAVAFHAAGITCPECLAILGPLRDRRQRALEALRDAASSITELPAPVDPVLVAINVATTVKITHDIIRAFIEAPDRADDIAGPLIAAFRAAGFEVTE
jgi:hypothetical protein